MKRERERERERGSGKQIAWQHKKNRKILLKKVNVRYFFTNTNSKKFSYIMRMYWMNYCGTVPSRERERVRERGGGGGGGGRKNKIKKEEAEKK